MAIADITLSKGGITVTIYANDVAEQYTNKLFPITPAQASANQASGPKPVKIVDLLRITREIQIKGVITGTGSKTAKQIKDELKSIYNGGSIAGGVIAMVYDGDTINGYMEKLLIREIPRDEPSDFESEYTAYTDIVKYDVVINFMEGVAI